MYLLCATQSLAKCVSAGITWNYFRVDPFFLTFLLSFRFVCAVSGLLILNMTTITNEKEIVILAGMFNVHFHSDLSSCEYDARRSNSNNSSSYGLDMFSFAHMVLVDNKFDSSINGGDSDGTSNCNELYMFFTMVLCLFWSRKTSGSILLTMRKETYHIAKFIFAQPF